MCCQGREIQNCLVHRVLTNFDRNMQKKFTELGTKNTQELKFVSQRTRLHFEPLPAAVLFTQNIIRV